jgi:hypothetical protein
MFVSLEMQPRTTQDATYQTSPKAPIPTGCNSVYLNQESALSTLREDCAPSRLKDCEPAGDLEGGAEDLGTHEFRHDERGYGYGIREEVKLESKKG